MHNYCKFYFTEKYINRRYFLILEYMYEENVYFHLFLKSKTLRNKKAHYGVFFDYTYFYHVLFQKISYDAFNFVKKLKKKKTRNTYNLILTFRKNKFFINLNDEIKQNYFFLSTGFFIKFFDKKKIYKKSKIIRTLMAKYLRKIYLLLNFPRTIVLVKKNPIFFLEFLNLFNQQIPHKFNEPLTNKEIKDENPNKLVTKFLYFIFISSQSYVNNKTKKQGRVKRKISRKIVIRNSLID